MTPAQAYAAVDDTGDHLDKTHVPHLTAEQREQQQAMTTGEMAVFLAVCIGGSALTLWLAKCLAELGWGAL